MIYLVAATSAFLSAATASFNASFAASTAVWDSFFSRASFAAVSASCIAVQLASVYASLLKPSAVEIAFSRADVSTVISVEAVGAD